MAELPRDVRSADAPAVSSTHFRAAMARLEGEQLPQAEYAAHRSLEALRLEDAAIICGCWNTGCAAALAMAGYQSTLDD